MKKVKIDGNVCISCGHCVEVDDQVFELLPGETAKVKETANFEVDQTKIDQAIAECPVQAISWAEEEVVVDDRVVEPNEDQEEENVVAPSSPETEETVEGEE